MKEQLFLIISNNRLDQFHSVIINKYTKWLHFLDFAWIIRTDSTLVEVTNFISTLYQGKFLVTPITQEVDGFLPQRAWEWIVREDDIANRLNNDPTLCIKVSEYLNKEGNFSSLKEADYVIDKLGSETSTFEKDIAHNRMLSIMINGQKQDWENLYG